METRLADVPAVLVPPEGDDAAPVVVCWHGFGVPADARSLCRDLPLEGLHAWRVYLDLPHFGHRLPEIGPRELARRQAEDYLVELLWPVVSRAAEELPRVLSALDERLGGLRAPETGLVGVSAGGTAVLHALAEEAVTGVRAAAVIGAPPDARSAVTAFERASGLDYAWTEEARRVAGRLDVAARAGRIAARDPPPSLLVVQGAADDVVRPDEGRALLDALLGAYGRMGRDTGRVEGTIVPGLGHGPSGRDPEAGVAASREADRRVAAWLGGRLA